jgi:hypothetical protein
MRTPARKLRLPLIALSLAPFALLALGCKATGGSPHVPTTVPRDPFGLTLVEERGGFQHEWRKPGLDLGAYDRILLLPLELVYTEQFTRNHRFDSNRFGRHWPPKSRLARQREEDLAQMRKIFRETLEAELTRRGAYTLVDETGPGVLSLSVGVVDVDLARSRAELNLRGLTAFDRLPTITISASIRDGASAERLGLMVKPSTNFGTVTKSGAGGSLWGNIRLAFDRWARGFGALLDEQKAGASQLRPSA